MEDSGGCNLHRDARAEPGDPSSLSAELARHYGRTFQDIALALREANDLDFFAQMHATEKVLQAAPRSHAAVTHGNSYPLLRDMLEDLRAALLCFQNGFLRQTLGILRGTFESAIGIYYRRYLRDEQGGPDALARMAELLTRVLALKGDRELADCLGILRERLYGNIEPKEALWLRDEKRKPAFDPAAMLYTKGLFFSLLECEFRVLGLYAQEGEKTVWSAPILSAISSVLERVNRYQPTIGNFLKGYVVHKEHLLLPTGSEVLYSVRLDGSVVRHGQHAPELNMEQLKRVGETIRQRLLMDLY